MSAVPSAPASDLSAVITLMTNAVNQGNSNMTAITDALQKTTSQFADALQKTIQMGVDAQADETRNARLDKQFDKIKVFNGSNPADCQEDPSGKCYYYVLVRLSKISLHTCLRTQPMIR